MTRDQATLLRLLQRHPRGITLVDLMLTLGRTQSACVSDLHALQEAGEAGSVRAPDAAPVWAARSDLQALRDAQAAKRSTPKPARLTAAMFLRALADLLETYQATLGYSTDDRGVEIDVGGVEVAAIWCNDTACGAKELRERADQLEARG